MGAKRYGVDHQIDRVEFEPMTSNRLPAGIGSDGKHPGWVSVWFEIENGDGVVEE
jgi:hypothetical protein